MLTLLLPKWMREMMDPPPISCRSLIILGTYQQNFKCRRVSQKIPTVHLKIFRVPFFGFTRFMFVIWRDTLNVCFNLYQPFFLYLILYHSWFFSIKHYGFFQAKGSGMNWGMQITHPLSRKILVKLLKDNGFDRDKLFEPDPDALMSLGNSGILIIFRITNEFLEPLSNNVLATVD